MNELVNIHHSINTNILDISQMLGEAECNHRTIPLVCSLGQGRKPH